MQKDTCNRRQLLPTLDHKEKPNEIDINVEACILAVFVIFFSNGNNKCAFIRSHNIAKHLKFSKI